MSIKKIAAIICALSMTTAMLASCGDTDDSSSSSSSTADAASSAATAADSTADSAAEESAAESAAESLVDTEVEVWEPITEFAGYDAFLMFGDNEWLWGNWEGTGYPDGAGYGNDADITGDGEYTVSITSASIAGTDDAPNPNVVIDENSGYPLPATGSVVFCVDITGICDGTKNYKGEEIKNNKLKEGDDANVNKETAGKYVGDEITVEVTSIKADGKEVEFDPSKIVYGNIEDNNNCYRIEIFNSYGDTAADPAIDINALTFEEELSVTFTISGLTEEG